MTNPTPPGWYPDGRDIGGQRWWDGTGWTEHVQQPYQAGGTIPRAPEGTSPNTPHIWWIVGVFAAQLIVSAIYLATIDWSGYMRAMSTMSDSFADISGAYSFVFNPAYFAVLAASLFGWAGTIALAYFDSKALASRGIERPFHWALSFIPSYGAMVYVIGRSVVVKRRTGTGLGPLWAFIAVFVLGIVVTTVAMFGGMATALNQLSEYGLYN